MLSTAPVIARVATPAVEVCPVLRRDDWERLYAQVPVPHFTQAWCYGEGKRAESWNIERLVFSEGGMPAAICQVLSKKVAGFTVVARINRGPLFLERTPAQYTKLAIYRELRRRWRFARRGLLFLAPSLPAGDASEALLREAGFLRRRQGGWHSACIDLQLPLETIRMRVSREWRKNLNAALKDDIGLRIGAGREDLDWMLERHADNMNRKGFAGPGSRFLRAMIESSPDDFRVFRASIDEQPCSGLMVARFGTQAETCLSWTSEAGRRANAHTFLMWHAFVEMKRLGCRTLDLGGYSSQSKYGAYKRTMKGQEYELAGEWLAF